MAERVWDDENCAAEQMVWMIYIMVGLPYKNKDKFGLVDSAL